MAPAAARPSAVVPAPARAPVPAPAPVRASAPVPAPGAPSPAPGASVPGAAASARGGAASGPAARGAGRACISARRASMTGRILVTRRSSSWSSCMRWSMSRAMAVSGSSGAYPERAVASRRNRPRATSRSTAPGTASVPTCGTHAGPSRRASGWRRKYRYVSSSSGETPKADIVCAAKPVPRRVAVRSRCAKHRLVCQRAD
ncbi:hypothetical protein D7M15_13540 [Streptomyces sp. Z26]|nr:hypothetical protein D7M15_13540 [Streptomyces sp. Z26]